MNTIQGRSGGLTLPTLGLGEGTNSRWLAGFEQMIEPMFAMLSLVLLVEYFHGELRPRYMLLALAMFALTFPGRNRLVNSFGKAALKILAGWVLLAGLVLFFLWASRFLAYYDLTLLLSWMAIAPLAMLAGHLVFRMSLPYLRVLEGPPERVVVAGANPQGLELVRRMLASPYYHVQLVGYFDDRRDDRIGEAKGHAMLGRIADMPELDRKSVV